MDGVHIGEIQDIGFRAFHPGDQAAGGPGIQDARGTEDSIIHLLVVSTNLAKMRGI